MPPLKANMIRTSQSTVPRLLVLVLYVALGLSALDGGAESITLVRPHGENVVFDAQRGAAFLTKAALSEQFSASGITFNLAYDDIDTGFTDPVSGPALRAHLQDVLAYVASIVNYTDRTLDIQVEASEFDGTGSLATAGTFYPGIPGVHAGSTFQRLESGFKPFLLFPEITIMVDLGFAWNVDAGQPEFHEADFFSVLLHEVTHGLGFASVIDPDGSSALGNGNYTAYDQLLFDPVDNQPLLSDSFPPAFQSGATALTGGALEFEVTRQDVGNLPKLPVKIMMNVGNPELAFEFAQIPNAGVGLARLEFVINNMIGIHPKAILEVAQAPASLHEEILRRARGYASPEAFFVEKLAEGVATIAAAFYPNPVIVRLSDFKSNEYRKLLGGEIYEPEEENPMLGFRGASRYVAPSFRDCFELECRAMKRVRNDMGLTNVQLMVPFVRTVSEASAVVDLLAAHDLRRGENELKLIMMFEIPSNALLAESFLEYFDGYSIGSNDLTQLTLGLDRDSGLVAQSFDERDPAVKQLLSMTIATCNRLGKYVGICGQGPSDHADFAEWLMDEGIQTISLNPDTVVDTWLRLASHKK